MRRAGTAPSAEPSQAPECLDPRRAERDAGQRGGPSAIKRCRLGWDLTLEAQRTAAHALSSKCASRPRIVLNWTLASTRHISRADGGDSDDWCGLYPSEAEVILVNDVGIFTGGLVVGLVGGVAYGVSKNPVWAFMGVAAAGIVIFGVVFATPITPGSGDSSAVLGIPGTVGFFIGLAAGWYGGTRVSESS